MKNISKHLISLAILALLIVPGFALTAHAQFDPGLNQVSTGLNNSLSQADPRTVIGRIINMALGFLGVLAVGIVLLGGFKWMTAGGNEEKTGEAKKLLGAGVIGLVIILSSWAIANFIISSLNTAVQQ